MKRRATEPNLGRRRILGEVPHSGILTGNVAIVKIFNSQAILSGVYALTVNRPSAYAVNNDNAGSETHLRYAHTPDFMEASGALAVRKSSTHTSRKTIRMQINDLYSDKADAIVREITANADDSHRRAEQDRPFYVHCPEPLQPEFYVRDFGCGMTDQVMEDIYIVIGLSDKDDSDAETGMWGLGSKTPFAYADHYTITCYDGETARHYGYGIANDGIPNLYTLAIEPSTEPRGVRIGLAIESKDFHLFETAIRKAAVAHEGKFEHNLGNLNLGEVIYEGEDWKAYSGSPLEVKNTYAQQRWWVRQGSVLYPIADARITIPHDGRLSGSRTYILDCPIGAVRMTPSREALQYGEEEVAYLKGRIEAVSAEIGDAIYEATKDIVSVVDYYERVAKLKPEFVKREFVHPATGLKSVLMPMGYPQALLTAKKGNGGEMEFDTPAQLDLRFTGGRSNLIFALKDIGPLLDPSRGDQDTSEGVQRWLTRSEMRRVGRFLRHYMEHKGVQSATIACNVDWSADFITAITTQGGGVVARVEALTFDDLRAVVPRRVAPPTAPKDSTPIRGLALAKAAGEQKPVYEVQAPTPTTAWVSSDEYRKQAGPIFKLARKAGLESLYIAAVGDAQKQITDAGHPHLSVMLEAMFKKAGWNMRVHEYVRLHFRSGYTTKVVDFLLALKGAAPEQYDRLAQGEGAISDIAARLSKYMDKPLIQFSDEERKVLEVLLPDLDKTVPKALTQAYKLYGALASYYENPTMKFISELKVKTSNAESYVSAVLALQTLIDPTQRH